MNLIDRYVYAVVKRLPLKQREDIEKEIRTLIEDMLEQYQGEESKEKRLEKVLLELGDPALLADNYRESKRYLIGPQNFENYLMVLKIVLGAVFLGISVATVVASFVAAKENIVDIIVGYLSSLFYGELQAFAWVTVGFAIAEYNGAKVPGRKEKENHWSLSDLPEAPQKEALISRVEPVMGVLFLTIFTCIFYFAPQVIAAYFSDGANGLRVIPVFDLEVLSRLKGLIFPIFFCGILKEVRKFMAGRWSLKLAYEVVPLTVVSLLFTVILFSNPNIWNANFFSEMMGYVNVKIVAVSAIDSLAKGFIAIAIIGSLVEIATALYKGHKYSA